ncbi:hypothetical protein HYT23_04830 [Candidatus Pacearchaeota archaeon]|nr:hypothetical protein [Candidatus Pacearchaeota archaeon]
MDKKNWIIPIIILILIALVIIFREKFIVREEEIIEADYCEADTDCVLAVNPYNCCIQPVPMNKDVVELDEEFVIYDKNFDYSDYKSKEDCSFKECPASPQIIADVYLKCSNNKCVTGAVEDENLEFFYNISVSNEYYAGNLSIEDIDSMADPIENPENFTEITIKENKLIIKQAFAKPDPCTSINYTVQKNNSVINIIPKIISQDNNGGCAAVLAYDEVEINIILENGEYLVNIYDLWNLNEPFFNKTIII